MSDDKETEIDNASFEDTFSRDLLESSFRIKKEHRRLGKLLGTALKHTNQQLEDEAIDLDSIATSSDPLQVLVYSMILLEFVDKILRGAVRETGDGGQGPVSQAPAAVPPDAGDSP